MRYKVHPFIFLAMLIMLGAIFIFSLSAEDKNYMESVYEMENHKKNPYTLYPDFPYVEHDSNKKYPPIEFEGYWWIYDVNLEEYIKSEYSIN